MASFTALATRQTTNAALTPRNTNPATPQPIKAVASETPVATPSPGRWRHPKLDEITRRQNASTFTSDSLNRILWNTLFIALLYLLRSNLASETSVLSFLVPTPAQAYLDNALFYLNLLPIYNILVALLPLYYGTDNVSDIPLTPTQRALLGLDPNATPPLTPGTQYITPPRYARSPTPRTNPNSPAGSSRSRQSSAGRTPLRDRSSESPSYNSPYSPNASPSLLWSQKSGFGSDSKLGLRKSSMGQSPSPLGLGLGRSASESLWSAPATPSPLAGKGQGTASVGLNSRWLYERGRLAR
ncbi:MAG: hypothetical protein L6R37_004231 [Teloschistes peruensis]|nr:MAG: hypothetical protein L6R37_004231 [Teloschistes peruensis]